MANFTYMLYTHGESGVFEWDDWKDVENQYKHGISFVDSQAAFRDRHRVIVDDLEHSMQEKRFFCFGMTENGVLTVRFTLREHRIRIIGAGYWRKGRVYYEKENRLHGGADREDPGDQGLSASA